MALPVKFTINVLLFIMSIFGTAIISFTNLRLSSSSMTIQRNEGGQCLLTAGVNEGDSPQTHCVQCTIEKCNDGELLHMPDIAALWSVIRLYYSSTLSKMSNHPICWMIICLFFHSVMMSSYCGGVLWEWTQRELSLWTFYWLSYVYPLAKLLVYVGIVIKTVIWIILSSVYSKGVPFSRKSHFRELFGYCRGKRFSRLICIHGNGLAFLKR